MVYPIGFSDEQLRIIKAAAKHIPYSWRGRFLEALCNELLPVEVIVDEHVHDAARFVLMRMNVIA